MACECDHGLVDHDLEKATPPAPGIVITKCKVCKCPKYKRKT